MKHKKTQKQTQFLSAMDSNSKDEECHIVLNPAESPIYGGQNLEIIFNESIVLPTNDVEFYIVFWGLTARHVTLAVRRDYRTLEAVVPGHDRFEDAHLAVCALQPGLSDDVRILAKSNFIFSPDPTFYLAQFLASSVWDPDSLDNPQAIKSEHFDLQTEDRSTLDSRLTAAFQHLEFPSTWNLVVDSGRLDENPPPRESLLHFATRLQLIKFTEHLLERPGCLTALHLPNKNGELPYDVAKAKGMNKLADRMLQLAQHEEITAPKFENISSNHSKVKQHRHLGTASVSTKVHETKRTLEDDVQMLREIVSCLEREERERDSPESDNSKHDDDDDDDVNSPAPTSPDTLEEILTQRSSDGEVELEIRKEDSDEILNVNQSNASEEDEQKQDDGDANKKDGDGDGDDDDDEEDDEDDDEDDDDDDDEDGENNSEEAEELADSMLSFDEDLQRLREVGNKVHRFKEQNRPWMSSAEERRENLSKWSVSCPLLIEHAKQSKVSKREYLPNLPNATANSSDDEEEEDELNSGERSPRVQIQVNDTILDSTDDLPSVIVPSIEDAAAETPLSSVEAEDLQSTRRHSWGDQALEMKSEVVPTDLRCRSMLNLDSNDGTEDFHIPKEKPFLATAQPKESKTVENGSTVTDTQSEKSSVTFQDGPSGSNDPDVVVSGVSHDKHATEEHSQVVRRRKKIQKDIRKQKSASMFEARSDDSGESVPSDEPTPSRYLSDPSPSERAVIIESILDESREDPIVPEKNRQSRLSLNEFINDPLNFVPEMYEKEPQAESSSRNAVLRKLSILKRAKRDKKKSKEKDREREKDDRDGGAGDKEKGKSHQFVAVSFSNSTLCDSCGKSLLNKQGFQCTACSANLHNGSCKENFGHCSKLTIHPKALPKSSGSFMQERFNSRLQGSNLVHTHSLREKNHPNYEHHPIQIRSQSFPKNAFHGSTPELRYPTSATSYELGKWHWHRVAVKLGVNRTIDESEESEEVPPSPTKNSFQNNLSYSTESLDDVSSTLDYEPDPDLTIGPEPESWSASVDKKVLKKMSNKEVKRQDVIFEFIMTEKHHLRTLKVMQKIFSYGMTHELNMEQTIVSKVFPMLSELVDIASTFYDSLKARQEESLEVQKIGDVLCKQFEGEIGNRMMVAYGHLCCHQKEAVGVYKELQKTKPKFQQFIKKCSMNALCRRWSIPECILAVSHRLTKYQLLIEAIIKPSKAAKADKQDLTDLEKALGLIKGICNEVDSQVQEYEKHQRLIEIYNKIEARSTAPMKNGKKFKKSDLLATNRKLIKEGEVYWKSARGRLTEVHVVLVSDLLFLFSENSQKFTFAAQDNKPPVISLENLMVRDVAIDNKSIYIISRNKQGPEMYEITCKTSQSRKDWKQAIEHAVTNCPTREETAEDERRQAEEKAAKMNKLLEEMKEKDKLLEDIIAARMKLMKEIHELAVSREDISAQHVKSTDSDVNLSETKDVLQAAIREAASLQSLAYSDNVNFTFGRNGLGERESLPKRADTFSGFDNSSQGLKKRTLSNLVLAESSNRSSSFPNLSNSDNLSSPQGSPLRLSGSDISREEDVLSPLSPPSRDGSQRSPLPQRRGSERGGESIPSGRRGSVELRGRSHTVSSDVVSKVQFNVPVDEGKDKRQDLTDRGGGGDGDDVQLSAFGGMTSEQLSSVNQLLKHFYILLPLITKKDNELEALRRELTETRNKLETYKSHSPTQARKLTSSSLDNPAGQDNRGKIIAGRSASLHDKPEQNSAFRGSQTSQENLDRIAFGDMMPSNHTVRYRNHSQSTYSKDCADVSQAPQMASRHKHRYSSAELISRMDGYDPETTPSPPSGSSANFKRHTPAHLMSTTNEQAANNRNVRQQLPMQLSKGKQSGSKTTQVQQVLPKKLSSRSSQNSVSSQKGGKVNSPQSPPTTDEVIYF